MDLRDATEVVPSLQQAFEAFNTSAQKLSAAYAELEEKFKHVNQELEETNLRLRQNLEEKQRLHQYLESILNSMSSGIVVFNLEGEITLFNHGAEHFTGKKASDVLGKSAQVVFGEPRYSEPKPYSEHEATPSWSATDNKVPLDIRTDLVKDAEGTLLGILLLIEDVSERKRLEEQVRRTNTLAALGKMAAEIAHEIRNPLAAMQIYTRILQQELRDDNRQLADDIMAGIRSLEMISGNMLSLARPVPPRFERIDLVKVLESALDFSIYALEENEIKLVRNYPASGVICEADFEQLKQVTLNLLLNAIQAMPHGGTLQIAITRPEDRYLVWTVCDTGCGIPQEHLERIFTPFYSTKPSGTGLGLHTVERILQMHRAAIEVTSEVGKGTQFRIHLPIQQTQ